LPKYFKTASSRISKEQYEEFEKYCLKHNCTIHTMLKEMIDEKLGQEEKNVGKKRRLENGNTEDSARRIEPVIQVGAEDSTIPPFLR